MSFDDLVKSDLARKSVPLVIKSGDKEIEFTANELTYPQRLQIAILQQNGGDSFSQLIVFSIKDKDGRSMTMSQAQSLPEEYFVKFFEAATKVNVVEEKN